MSSHFLVFSNASGLVSFSIAGTLTGLQRNNRATPCICSVLTTFGGGMILRDLSLLHIVPTALVNRNELYICLLIALFLRIFANQKAPLYKKIVRSRSFRALLSVLDAFGCGMYICIGINKAIAFQLPGVLCIASGIFTAVGGGILSSLWCKMPVRAAITKNPVYKGIVLLSAIEYYQMAIRSNCSEEAQKALIISVVALLSLASLTGFLIAHKKKFYVLTANITYKQIPAGLLLKNYQWCGYSTRGKNMLYSNISYIHTPSHHMLLP